MSRGERWPVKERGRMTTSHWSAEEYPGDSDPWRFAIIDPKCRCGWFLSDAVPIMGRTGVCGVEGTCKRHGEVDAATWDICDEYPEERA